MATDISIASNALLLIGDEEISSFTDSGFGATVASKLYEATYHEVLGCHPWSFALKEQTLSRLTAAPDTKTGYNYAYQIPSDCIRIWELMEHSDYVIVGNLIYSNLDSILCRYVYEVSESQLPDYVVKAIEYRLASEFAVPVTENTSTAAYYEQKYGAQIVKAMAIDSQNRPQQGIIDSPFVDVRFGGIRGYSY